jgi:hypothetical protein
MCNIVSYLYTLRNWMVLLLDGVFIVLAIMFPFDMSICFAVTRFKCSD